MVFGTVVPGSNPGEGASPHNLMVKLRTLNPSFQVRVLVGVLVLKNHPFGYKNLPFCGYKMTIICSAYLYEI